MDLDQLVKVVRGELDTYRQSPDLWRKLTPLAKPSASNLGSLKDTLPALIVLAISGKRWADVADSLLKQAALSLSEYQRLDMAVQMLNRLHGRGDVQLEQLVANLVEGWALSNKDRRQLLYKNIMNVVHDARARIRNSPASPHANAG